jgi:hypothetical protein
MKIILQNGHHYTLVKGPNLIIFLVTRDADHNQWYRKKGKNRQPARLRSLGTQYT